MLVTIILYGLLIAGGFFGSAVLNRKFEEIFPISIMSIAIILFLFGVFKMLETGVVAVLTVIILLYVISALKLLKNKKNSFIVNFFTPAFFIFTVLYLVLNIAEFGLVARFWDEFSHWMDCVKAMTYLNDFVANPESHSLFRTYPPIMSLFQYFVQKLYLFVHPNRPFNEWRMYLAYQMFALSVLFPFFSKLSLKNPFKNMLCSIVVLVSPILFEPNFYSTLYIDPFLSILTAAGFFAILKMRKNSVYYTYMSLLCATLVLAKEVGLFFAVFIAFAVIVDCIIRVVGDREKNPGVYYYKKAWPMLMPMLSLVLAKLLWSHVLRQYGLNGNSGSQIDLWNYTKMFFTHCDTSYRQAVVDSFKKAFFIRNLYVGRGTYIGYYSLFFIFFLLIYLILKRTVNDAVTHRRYRAVAVIIMLQMILYIYCLGAAYVYNFSEYEATRLASYERYMGIEYMALGLMVSLGTIDLINDNVEWNSTKFIIIAVLFATIFPFSRVSNFLGRYIIRDEYVMRRAELDELKNIINKQCDGDDKIYYISQESNGYDFYVTKFNARPNWVANNGFTGWSLGGPFYEGDIWYISISAEELMQKLIDEGYNYLAIYRANDYFIENYADIFVNADEIIDNSLYLVNKEAKILERCE
ncbi:MAG: hypothetical protein GX272_08980 [Epulopiscium sp.]|nr:hypothetical protein [Candidatus Epulonipiscium sp.]